MVLKRGASTGLITALGAHFHPCLLVEADHPDGIVHVHSGIGAMTWDGKTWLWLGPYGSISIPEESGGLAASEATFSIAATLATVLAERGKEIRNLETTAWFGVTTEPGGNVLAQTPVELFSGYFDSRTFRFARSDDDLSHDLVLGVGIGPGARSRASITHGPEDQEMKYPGDTAGRQVINAIKRMMNPPSWPEL